MAYGNDTVTLATFDAVIPNPVFLEVTSITLDQFRFLRDGGKYKDAETGEEKELAGNLFDPVVFDDSVKEFLRLKKKLADYFDEKSIEDIFDYIPPQKTNQIFTPKTMVKKMVDTQRKGRSKKNWTSCSDKNENSRIKFRFWSSYFSVCDETYTCVCTSKCNTEICKTKCNGGVAFTFANEFCLFFLGKTVDKLTVHRYNNRAALNGL